MTSKGKVVAIVQARLGSSRLPLKSLLCLRDLPVIDWVARRLAAASRLDGIMVAVPDTPLDVVLLGGSFQHDAEANVGPLTKLGLSQFSVDKCFIGADAISEEKGVSTINLFRAEVVRSMSESAGKMIVLTTSDKIGGSAVASVFPLDHLHTLITDTDIKPADQHMLERAGVNVLTV